MFDVDAFVIRGHQKVIDYYRWLRDSTVSDVERERFQRRMDEESAALTSLLRNQNRPLTQKQAVTQARNRDVASRLRGAGNPS
jgi:hypothetical protein